jgi:hypothetical protein
VRFMLAAPFAKNSRVNLRAVDQPPRSQLSNFQWLALPIGGSLFLLFTYSWHRRLFINQSFLEQSRSAPSTC